MTTRIRVKTLLLILYTAAVLGGAFGISYLVFDWRDGGVNSPAVFECWEEAWADYVDAREEAPDPPPRGSGEKALKRYNNKFVATKEHNAEAWDEYTDRVKECYP